MRHVLLLRHGETVSSSGGAFTGRSNAPLTEQGVTQASRWQSVLRGFDVAAFASPLRRATQTASVAGLAATPSDLLLEWDLGSLEGVSADGYRRDHPDWNLFVDGVLDGSGENPAAVERRAGAAWEQLTSANAGFVVAVSHGQFLKSLVAHVAGLPPSAASAFSLGPARAGLLTQRATGRFSITGWNLSPVPLATGLLSGLT